MSISKRDRRDNPRRNVTAHVTMCRESGKEYASLSRDISDSGMFLLVPEISQPSVGEVLKFRLLDSINPEIVFFSSLVHAREDGIGVQITGYEYQGQHHALEELRQHWQIKGRQAPGNHGSG